MRQQQKHFHKFLGVVLCLIALIALASISAFALGEEPATTEPTAVTLEESISQKEEEETAPEVDIPSAEENGESQQGEMPLLAQAVSSLREGLPEVDVDLLTQGAKTVLPFVAVAHIARNGLLLAALPVAAVSGLAALCGTALATAAVGAGTAVALGAAALPLALPVVTTAALPAVASLAAVPALAISALAVPAVALGGFVALSAPLALGAVLTAPVLLATTVVAAGVLALPVLALPLIAVPLFAIPALLMIPLVTAVPVVLGAALLAAPALLTAAAFTALSFGVTLAEGLKILVRLAVLNGMIFFAVKLATLPLKILAVEILTLPLKILMVKIATLPLKIVAAQVALIPLKLVAISLAVKLVAVPLKLAVLNRVVRKMILFRLAPLPLKLLMAGRMILKLAALPLKLGLTVRLVLKVVVPLHLISLAHAARFLFMLPLWISLPGALNFWFVRLPLILLTGHGLRRIIELPFVLAARMVRHAILLHFALIPVKALALTLAVLALRWAVKTVVLIVVTALTLVFRLVFHLAIIVTAIVVRLLMVTLPLMFLEAAVMVGLVIMWNLILSNDLVNEGISLYSKVTGAARAALDMVSEDVLSLLNEVRKEAYDAADEEYQAAYDEAYAEAYQTAYDEAYKRYSSSLISSVRKNAESLAKAAGELAGAAAGSAAGILARTNASLEAVAAKTEELYNEFLEKEKEGARAEAVMAIIEWSFDLIAPVIKAAGPYLAAAAVLLIPGPSLVKFAFLANAWEQWLEDKDQIEDFVQMIKDIIEVLQNPDADSIFEILERILKTT